MWGQRQDVLHELQGSQAELCHTVMQDTLGKADAALWLYSDAFDDFRLKFGLEE